MSKVSFDSHYYFQRYASNKLIIAKTAKRNNSVITCERATVLAFTQPLIALYQCVKFHLIPFKNFEIHAPDNLIIAKIRKGTSSVITCERVMVLALYTSSDDFLSIYQALFNSLLYFQRYAPDKLNIGQIRKGSNSINTGDGVVVLALCTFPYGPLSVYQISFNFRDMLRTSLLLQKNRKGNNSVITCYSVTVLAFCTFSDGLQCKFHLIQSILSEICSGQAFIAKLIKGSNSVKTGDRVTVLAICSFSDGSLSMYQVY